MSNWQNVEAAVKSASEAEGSAARENAKYVDSLQGRLDKLTTAWQSFANTFMNSDFLKGGISALTTFVEILEGLIDNLGSFGTIGLGVGIFGLFKNFNKIKEVFTLFSAIPSELRSVKGLFSDLGKTFTSSMTGIASGIGLAIAAISLIINAYKNYREEISKARQETIQASNEFLDSASSFEQAYIKYSGRTDLTAEEEAELESAINGTVEALDDKSSALSNVVSGSKDYLASLESIKRAELEAAEAAAKSKRDNAALELEDTAFGWSRLDGAEVNIELSKSSKEAIDIANGMNSKFVSEVSRQVHAGVNTTTKFALPDTADVEEIVEYYNFLLEYQEKLSDAKLRDTTAYEQVTNAIDKLSESVGVYVDGVYEAAKAQYQLSEGIPKTVDQYVEMREAILGSDDIKNKSLYTKMNIVNSLDSEYGQIFDLTDAEVQARRLIGVFDKYGESEAGQVEAFLNMKTAVNNNECTVGEYISEFDKVNAMTDGWSEDEKEIFNTSFGLDVDSIKEQYEDVYNYINRNYLSKLDTTGMPRFTANLYKEAEVDKIKNILDNLTATELQAVANIKAEIDWENSNIDSILKQIKDEAKFVEAMNFTISIDVETESVDALNTAMAESVSATGLSSESISALKDRYAELESKGYDLSAMFEETANGIHLNKGAVSELEQAYASDKLSETKDNLDVLKNRYDELTGEIDACTDASERASLYREQQSIAQKINDLGTLAAQYEGLASSYNAWLSAEEAGSERDMYEKVIEGFENIGDEISRGWYDDGTIKFLELMTGETDLATKSATELKEIWNSLDDTIKGTSYSVKDFFTVDKDGNSTSTGAYNFLRAVEQLGKNGTLKALEGQNIEDLIVRNDKDKIVGFDFNVVGGDKAVADALGVSEEMVQIIQRALDDAGFVVTLDGNWTQFADLQNQAEKANDVIKKLAQTNDKLKNAGFGDYEFNFGASDIETISGELEKAKELLSNPAFQKDGKFNIKAEGAKDALKIAETLQITKSKLEEPAYMSIDVSELQKELQEPVKQLQEFEKLTQEKDLLNLTGTDTKRLSEIDGELDKIAKNLSELPDETKIDLGIDGMTPEQIRKELENGTIEVPAELTIEANMDKSLEDLVTLGLLEQGLITEKEAKIRLGIEVEADEVDTSDVDEKVDEAIGRSSRGYSSETVRKQNIEIIAKTMGVEDIDDLTSKLKGLDDKTIQAIAEVLGRTDVDSLKYTLDNLGAEDKLQLQVIAEAIGKGDVEGLQTAIDNLSPNTVEAIAKALGYNDVESLKSAVANMDGNTVQAVAQALGLSDVNTLQITVNNMQGNTVDAKVDTSGQKEKINTLQSWINGLKGKIVQIGVSLASGGKKKAAQRTGADPAGNDSEVNGTANVNGTTGRAFKKGSWGTKTSGTALVGELGREVLVRDGKYYTIGDNGAEFIHYKQGDIIFNHVQSEELFKNGKVTSGGGRAKAFVGGTAFLQGTAFGSGSGGGEEAEVTSIVVGTNKNTGKSYTKSKDNDDFEETIDWIEIAISRIEREIDRLDTKASSIYRSWSERNSNLTNEISKVGDEIALQQRAYDEYMAAANAVGLSSDLAARVRNGTIDISTIKDEAVADKVSDYQKYYEAALDCQDAILDLKETESALYKQRFDNVATQYEGILSVVEHEKNMLEEYISQSEAQAWLVSSKYYDALAKNERENISKLEEEKNALISEFNTAMNSGKIDKYSEAWYEMVNAIDDVTLAITEGETALLEYAQTIQQLKWEQFDLLQDRISSITEETEFLIELMSSDKLFEDNGKLTDSGKATMGQHGVAYNTYMYQADLAAAEAERIKKEMAKDPYDTELEERYREMIALQQEYILNAQDEKEAIRDLVSEGIELELDALQEKISLYQESLDSQKD